MTFYVKIKPYTITPDYRERKILKRFQVTPVSPEKLLIVEFAIYCLYCVISMFTLFPVAKLFWKIRIHGSWLSFLGSWLLTMISTLSIGMIVGGIAKNMKTASAIASILYFPTLIFSGVTFPFEAMPSVMQKVISIFPLTQGIQLMKAAFLGLSVENAILPVAVMGVVTIVCFGISVKCFKWE